MKIKNIQILKRDDIYISSLFKYYLFSNLFETNTPHTNNPSNTTQKITVQSVECGKSWGISANFSCAAAITNSLIPTQPTIRNAAISKPGLVSNTLINILAA